MIDTESQRDLFGKKFEICDYQLDNSAQAITRLESCVISNVKNPSRVKIEPNKMLLSIGWGRVTTIKYTNSVGSEFTNSLYITEDAMRQLGFIDFFDLY